jgi:hypothetical protein
VRVVVQSMERDMANFRERFDQVDWRFDLADQRLAEVMKQVEQRLTVRLGSFMAVAVAVTATLVTLLRG